MHTHTHPQPNTQWTSPMSALCTLIANGFAMDVVAIVVVADGAAGGGGVAQRTHCKQANSKQTKRNAQNFRISAVSVAT